MLDNKRVFFLCKRSILFKTCTFLYVVDAYLGWVGTANSVSLQVIGHHLLAISVSWCWEGLPSIHAIGLFFCVNTKRFLLVSKVCLIAASCRSAIQTLYSGLSCNMCNFFFNPSSLYSIANYCCWEAQWEIGFFPYCDHKLHLYVFLNFGYPCVLNKKEKCSFNREFGGCMIKEDILRETLFISYLVSEKVFSMNWKFSTSIRRNAENVKLCT